jgi:hypothetical protein
LEPIKTLAARHIVIKALTLEWQTARDIYNKTNLDIATVFYWLHLECMLGPVERKIGIFRYVEDKSGKRIYVEYKLKSR